MAHAVGVPDPALVVRLRDISRTYRRAALLAFVASALVGIVAGVGPANQAAALEPASALRYE